MCTVFPNGRKDRNRISIYKHTLMSAYHLSEDLCKNHQASLCMVGKQETNTIIYQDKYPE